jgi:iron complex outermembrane receptor protein
MQPAHDGNAACGTHGALGWYLAAVTLTLLAARGATADESSSGVEPSASGLQEVTVYARRREERIEDTPVAITVRSGAQLQEEAALLIEDVGRDAPNTRMVSSPQSVSALDVTIRGQTVNRSAIMFDPAVGLYVDGVYIANGQGTMMTLLDVDSLEVIRGSQGTLFGRNNTGGSILLMTHRPDLGQTSAEVSLGGGNYDQFMDRAIFNLPIGSDLAIRVAYQGNYRSGFGSSLGSGQDNFENQHRYEARFGALWKPGDATELYFTYERFDATEIGGLLHPLTGPPPGTLVSQIGATFALFPQIPGLPTVSFPSNPYQTDGSFPAYDDAHTDSVQLTLTQKLASDLAAKLILGYRHLYANTALDVDATTLPLADTTLYNTSNQKSAELQLNGKALSQRLDWVAGLYWFQDNGGAPSVQAPASPQFLSALQELYTVTGGQVNFVNPPIFSAVPVYDQNWVSNRSEAAYVHGEYQLTSSWEAAAGVRYTDDRRQAADDAYVINPVPGAGVQCTLLDTSLPPPYLVGGPCPADNHSVSYDYWSWEVSSRYRLTPELMAYVRSGHSQRSGGWNVPFATLQDQPFRPETLTDYEIGMKADLMGGALVVNGDVFYGIYDDMQRLLARLNPDGTPVTVITNAGKARVSGAELEAQWRATARTTLGTSFGWTDARYDTFLYQPSYLPNPGLPPQNLANNEFYQTPRLSGDVYGSYRFPVAAGEVLLRADYAWQDRVEFNVINDFNYQGPYGTANARAALTSHARDWELALFADNLTDKHYAYTGGTLGAPLAPIPTIAWNVPGARRTAGIEGTYRWNTSH